MAVDNTPPSGSVSNVASPRNTAIDTVEIDFSEPVRTANLTAGVISLTRNGDVVTIASPVTISVISSTEIQVTGLSSLTSAEGAYVFAIPAASIEDLAGNATGAPIEASWLMDTTPPTSTVGALPAQTTSTTLTISASGTDDGSPAAGIASIELYSSVDGGPFVDIASLTQAPYATTFTGQTGHTYGFYSVAMDNAGNVEAIPTSADATTQIVYPTTTTVQSSEDPSKLGDSVTFTALVIAGEGSSTPTGSVQFSIDGVMVGLPADLSGGSAMFQISTLTVGDHSVTAAYTPDSGPFNPSNGTLSGGQTVNPADTTITVASSAQSSVYGESLTFTASVTPVTSGLPTPTGTAQVEIDGSPFGTAVSLINGSATSEAIHSLGAGAHTIAVVYSGDPNFAPSSSANLVQTVNPAPLAISTDDAVKVYGQPNPGFTATYTGFVLDEDPSVLGGVLTFTTIATDASHVQAGGYAVTPGGLTSTNYAIALIDGTLTITPAPLSIIALDQTTIYGAPLPEFTASYSGFVNGDTPDELATPVTLSTDATGLSPVGTYSIDASGATSTDYQIAFVPGTLTVTQAESVSGLMASPSSATSGQTVTLTATVTADAPSTGVPTGSVQFFVGTTSLGTALLSGNLATLTTTSLPVGTDSLTAQYLGDSNFTVSTSNTATVTINATGIATTTTVSSSANPSVFGQTVTLTAKIARATRGATLTGSVTFYDGSTVLGTATVARRRATLKTATMPVGSHAITAVYSGDANYASSNSDVLTQTVSQDSTTSKVKSSATPSVYGQSVTYTATVKADTPGSGTPSGTVDFYDGTTILGTGDLSAGTATFSTVFSVVGPHAITAVYSGDIDFTSGTSPALSQTVNQAGTTTLVISTVDPTVYGQPMTFTASVSPNFPGSGTPTGTITFSSGTTELGTAPLDGGAASLTTSAVLSVGNHTIKASYSGDNNFKTSAGTVVQTVNQDSTTATLVSSASPSVYGQSVTFTATVSANAPGSGTPSGSVTFMDGTTKLGTVTLSGGTASYNTAKLATGLHTITAAYNGSSSFTTSSAELSQLVNQDDTATSLSSSLNPSTFGQAVTFTAIVTATAPGSGTPTGTVTFYDGSTSLGTGNLSGGKATIKTSSLPVGSDPITVVYNADNSFLTSSSDVLTQVVNPGSNAAMAVSGSAVDRALSALEDEASDVQPLDEIAVGLIGFTGRRSRAGEGRSDDSPMGFSW